MWTSTTLWLAIDSTPNRAWLHAADYSCVDYVVCVYSRDIASLLPQEMNQTSWNKLLRRVMKHGALNMIQKPLAKVRREGIREIEHKPKKRQTRKTPSKIKQMLTTFFDSRETIHKEFVPSDRTQSLTGMWDTAAIGHTNKRKIWQSERERTDGKRKEFKQMHYLKKKKGYVQAMPPNALRCEYRAE